MLLSRRIITLFALFFVASLFMLARHSEAAPKRVAPQGFIGVNFNPWDIRLNGGDPVTELERASASGAESIRFPLYWFRVQPHKSMNDVPWWLQDQFTADIDGGAPYKWDELDRLMLAAARLRVSVLPTIMGAPAWADNPAYSDPDKPGYIPMRVPGDFNQFALFAKALVNRYKPSSSFWKERDSVPAVVVGWQIWNEPDHPNFWPAYIGESNGPKGAKLGWAPSYSQLFQTTRNAIKKEDSKSRVMLASLLGAPERSMAVYRATGAPNSFDQVSTNIFNIPQSTVNRIGKFRSYLRSQKTNPPIYLTEWTFLGGKDMWDQNASFLTRAITDTPQNVAKRLSQAMIYFVQNRARFGLAGIYWYCWSSHYDLEHDSIWAYAGLNDFTPAGILAQPGLAAFRKTALSLEGRS